MVTDSPQSPQSSTHNGSGRGFAAVPPIPRRLEGQARRRCHHGSGQLEGLQKTQAVGRLTEHTHKQTKRLIVKPRFERGGWRRTPRRGAATRREKFRKSVNTSTRIEAAGVRERLRHASISWRGGGGRADPYCPTGQAGCHHPIARA